MPRPRTWSDAQLIAAVRDSASWAEVSRRLGLAARGPTTKRLRGHTARLKIDTGHIPVRTAVAPRVSPGPMPDYPTIDSDNLREAVASSRSWAQIEAKLGYPRRANRSHARVRRAVADAGIDASGLYGQAWGRAPLDPLSVPFSNEFEPQLLHRMGTAVATAWFIGRGYTVSMPVEPACYDLVVESDSGLRRVQVKTARGVTARLTKTQYGLGSSPSTGKYGHRPYMVNEVDLFFILAASSAMYLIPIKAVMGKSGIALGRYERYRLPGLTERPYSNLEERSG
jgi:hypothetical protein